MRRGNIDVVAIDLKICLVIATVSDFEVGRRPDDVERNKTEPAIGPGRQLGRVVVLKGFLQNE
jgi:hypothetical protein